MPECQFGAETQHVDDASAAPANHHAETHDLHTAPKHNGIKPEAQNGHVAPPAVGQAEAAVPASPTPSKKRKREVSTQVERLQRALSPPWRSPGVAGPTSLIVDGKRRSLRTAAVPAEPETPTEREKTRTDGSQSKPRQSNGTLRNGNSAQSTPATNGARDKRVNDNASPFKVPAKPGKAPAKSQSRRRESAASVADDEQREGGPTINVAIHGSAKHHRRRSSRLTEDATPAPVTNGWHSSHQPKPTTPQRYPRLKLTVRDPTLPKLHPLHFPAPKKFSSLEEWAKHDDPLEGDTFKRLTDEQVEAEAKLRLRLAKEVEPGGLLSLEKCSRFLDNGWKEPQPRYGHWDYLTAHALNFQMLLQKENASHKRLAKQFAQWTQTAVETDDRWSFLREPKAQELLDAEEKEAQIKRYKQLVKDVETKWGMVRAEANQIRLKKWHEEQEVLGNKALDEMLDNSTRILHSYRTRESSEFLSELDDADSVTGTPVSESRMEDSHESGSEDPAQDENMSESEDDEDGAPDNDEDANLSPAALKRKYASALQAVDPFEFDSDEDASDEADEDNASEGASDAEASVMEIPNGDFSETPSRDQMDTPNGSAETPKVRPDEPESVIAADGDAGDAADSTPAFSGTPPPLEEVDPMLLDDSEDSTDMDSDMGSSCEDESDEEHSESGHDHVEEEDGGGLWGFFSKQTQQDLKTTLTNGETTDVDAVEDVPNGAASPSPEPDTRASQQTNGTDRGGSALPKITTSVTPSSGSLTPHTPRPNKTEVPSLLLRGTLREYQHDGLDWLAKLYTGSRNGILADEMGLGKTIQTIALLAHLAVHHEVWGPHLIVVPTSVMLNWEMEFKKWCPGFKILTYYGDQNERKKKREGWMNDDLWNVCITSYQLILQDAQAFKRRSWHYLVLDEAHNIKNFQTQRWQTLLTFKTHSRLLLTGTPLQNNLQELWSLLYFLMPAGLDGSGGFADLERFLNSMKKPADQILDQGRQKLDAEAQSRVNKLHEVLRPFLLRRLKAEVEKQMPGKYEHIVYCRLSKRQRQLYDEFMGRADTRRTLSSGNYMSIINCLMSLRKVCNHPDLFETRQIVTSFAMPKSVVADYEIQELLVRKRLLASESLDLDFCGLVPTANEHHSRLHTSRRADLHPIKELEDMIVAQGRKIGSDFVPDLSTAAGTLAAIRHRRDLETQSQLKNSVDHVRRNVQRWPIYGTDLVKLLTIPDRFRPPPPTRKQQAVYSCGEWYLNSNKLIAEAMPSLEDVAERQQILVTKFGCITPAVVAEDLVPLTLTSKGMDIVREAQQFAPGDPYHEGRIRLSIAFPDKRLLQYDCGKLQRLDKLLRELQAGGHRCLIFTQMTKVLDILETFLNIHGHRYLRLDGATKIEQRQILTDRFNNDKRILAFILSSRSGGLGINLTGADTVIFYDLDWNPAMDKQCQDRCHRIGQTRDVHIYRFVSEYTIEANILRKSNQKRLLDDVIIQKGDFTTDYFNRVTYRDALDDPDLAARGDDAEASAAMDRVLGEVTGLGQVLESVEDKEDTVAARTAQKEMVHVDDADFEENTPKTSVPPTPGGAVATPAVYEDKAADEEEEEAGDVEDYMVQFMMEELKNVPIVGVPTGRSRRSKKGKDYRRR
ncbi:hypothetical protein EJ06DRAFT_528919 [Trichodelitschia bisporula]|uniref:DNA helicase n=1 Tax=Trichodelitschia bisporula TaxID=703511 RepID=A0A6G1I0C2_9PEZI|nr:hypothetical protein EJ06DRAFT_528919 [Trichodelitschia bisporula]